MGAVMELYLIIYFVGFTMIAGSIPYLVFEHDIGAECLFLVGVSLVVLGIIVHHFDAIMEFIGGIFL